MASASLSAGLNDRVADTIRGFSANHVVRLTGLSHRQLHYWDDTGFFKPRYASPNKRSPFSRVYSFKDVVGLRTLGILRRDHRVPLQHLRKVARRLSQYREQPWSELVLYVLDKEVYFREPETKPIRSVIGGQYTLLPLRTVIHDVVKESEQLRKRTPEQVGRIERHRYVAHNAPVLAGTRIPTRVIARFHVSGYSPDRIVKEYPLLTREDVEAALRHEARIAKQA